MIKKNIYIFTRCIWTFINFRYDLVNRIDTKRYNICVCMDFDGNDKKTLEKKYKNITFVNINFLNKENSFIENLKILLEIYLLFLNNKIDIAHNFTARPIVFVSLVSFIFYKTKLINTITGLGNNFFHKKLFFKFIYNFLFLRSYFVVFQNHQDGKIIYKFLKKKNKIKIIFPAVKFKKYSKSNKNLSKKITFLMYSRMIKQKGVIEYINAINRIDSTDKKKSSFYLIGDPDNNNPSSISKKYLNLLNEKGSINYISHQKNIKKYILKSDVIVLPSYGEGLPAALLEALFFKKAIITTKVNGCLELVRNNFNGYAVEPKNSNQLYLAMFKIISNPKILNRFKKNSYSLYKKKFKKDSIQAYLKLYNSI